MAKSYINVDLPPGIKSNGTPYSNRGAWIDGDRVRWEDKSVRPIGGWQRLEMGGVQLPRLYSNPQQQAARNLAVWRTNNDASMLAVGTNRKLFAAGKDVATVYDITPEDFTIRPKGPAGSSGYGNWYYGTASYGTERPFDEDTALAFSWCLRIWGEQLLAAPRGAPSRLYAWDNTGANKATIVPNSPENFDCFHVTDQRIVMTAGAAGDPRIVKWSDSENNEVWNPLPLNKAGYQLLPGVGRFRDIVTLQDQYLLVSETDVYSARYVGAPFVFSFDQLGTNCGTPSPNAVVATNSFAMWPGHNSFFICDGQTVNRIECDVMDKFASSLNRAYASKTCGFVNPFWPEIWWLYQSGDGDVDSYVYYNWLSQHWGHGTLNRSCGAGFMTLGGLTMVSPSGYVYRHELRGVSPIENEASEIFVLSGPIELTNGNTTQYVKSIQPDFIDNGEVSIRLIGQDRPGGPKTTYGPYDVAFPALTDQPVPVRARGHTIQMRVESKSGNMTMGSVRLDFGAGGEK